MKIQSFAYILVIILGIGMWACAPSEEDAVAPITNQEHSQNFDHFKMDSIQYKNDATSSNIVYFTITFNQNVKAGIVDDIAALDVMDDEKAFLSLPQYFSNGYSYKWTWVSSDPKVIKGKIILPPPVAIGSSLQIELNQAGLEKIKDEQNHPLYIDTQALTQTLNSSGTRP